MPTSTCSSGAWTRVFQLRPDLPAAVYRRLCSGGPAGNTRWRTADAWRTWRRPTGSWRRSRTAISTQGHVHFCPVLSDHPLSLLRETDMLSVFPWPLVELCAQREGLCALPLREPVWAAPRSAPSAATALRPAAERFLEYLIRLIPSRWATPTRRIDACCGPSICWFEAAQGNQVMPVADLCLLTRYISPSA